MFGVLRPEPTNVPSYAQANRPPPPPPPRSLAPMPPSDYNSRDSLLEGVKSFAAHQGYAIVIARSRVNKLWLKCDRGGSYENRRQLAPEERRRKRGDSRLLGCPFRMRAHVKKDGAWHVETEVPTHNHGASDDLSQHPSLRKMTGQQLAKVHEMCEAGNTPAETVETLRQIWPDIRVITRDIYNARKKYKTEKGDQGENEEGMRPGFQDPNRLIPGPDESGRWAWLADGDEVTPRRSRKGKRMPPGQTIFPHTPTPATMGHAPTPPVLAHTPAPSALDPQLQTPAPPAPMSPITAAATAAARDIAASQATNSQFLSDLRNAVRQSSPNTVQTASEASNALARSTRNSNTSTTSPNNSNNNTTINASSNTATSTSTAQPNGTATAAPGQRPGGQVLMSRIERMEKEQLEQKNVLAQILGAVKGMTGSPGS